MDDNRRLWVACVAAAAITLATVAALVLGRGVPT